MPVSFSHNHPEYQQKDSPARCCTSSLNPRIYSFWRSAIFDSDKFIEKIHTTPVTIKEWKKQKLIHSNKRSRRFELGFATFFLNRTNVSGILTSGPIGGIQQQGKWKIDARFNKENLIKRIEALSLYKDRISVKNKDGIELIKTYLGDKNAFIYLDPPYYDKGATLYLNHYKEDNHKKLANVLNDNPDSFWLLTYDNKKEIKSLYPERHVTTFSLYHNAYKSHKGKEILIPSDALTI